MSQQVFTPINLNLDLSNLVKKGEQSPMILNLDRSSIGNKGVRTKYNGNLLYSELEMPAGENYTVGAYTCERTNEIYYLNWNSLGDHSWVRESEKGAEVVYVGPMPGVSVAPEGELTQFRAYLLEKKNDCGNRHGRYLIWVNGSGRIGCLDVEASIITDSFSTLFFATCENRESLTLLAVPEICGCIGVEPVANDTPHLENKLLDKGWQFIVKHEYYDGRESEWSLPSTMWFPGSGNCLSGNVLPRCLKLHVPVGGPEVVRVHVAYRNNNSNQYFLTDVIEKYKPYQTETQKWYERQLAISISNCITSITFCNDKRCEAVPPTQTNRVYNPEPHDVQSLLPIDNALGFINYRRGVCNLNKTELNKLSFSLEDGAADCMVQTVKVTIIAIVHNIWHDRNQFIYRMNGNPDAKDDKKDTAFFGGLLPSLNGGFHTEFGQSFNGETRNFIAYIEGTDYYAEFKQYFRTSSGEEWEMPPVSNMGDANTRNRWRRATRKGEYYFQKVELEVPKGLKGFVRIASHEATGNEQHTSTYVYAIHKDRRAYKGDAVLRPDSSGAAMLREGVELFFDTCEGDVDMGNTPFIIADPIEAGSTAVVYGYVKDKNGAPVEGLQVTSPLGFGDAYTVLNSTDHNGFYFVGARSKTGIRFLGEKSCGSFEQVHEFGSGSYNTKTATKIDVEIDDEDYANNYYSTVKITVKDCDGQVVSGIPIAIQGSKSVTTNIAGVATAQVRNYYTRDRKAIVVVMRNGSCSFYSCDGSCNPCMFSRVISFVNCFDGLPNIDMGDAIIGKVGTIASGLKAGGNYEFGITIRGNGRISFVQRNDWRLSPKTTQEKKEWSFPTVRWQCSQPLRLPDWVECVNFWRTENLNAFKLQWVVDKVEYIDAKGNSTGKVAAKQIRLTIQSLLDYNAANFYKTNTKYQYVEGDRIQFIQNGDGKIFEGKILDFRINSPFLDKNEAGIADEAPADFFNQILVDNDPSIRQISEGAIVELSGAGNCQTEPVFQSICATVPVVDGLMVLNSGRLTTFDTFFVTRTIGDKPPVKMEHHSPSDLWGERVNDQGALFTANEYDFSRRMGRNIILSDVEPFNQFSLDRVRTFDAPEQGDIIGAGIYDASVMVAICESDNFIAQVGDDFVRAGADGTVRVTPGSMIISDPQPKPYGAFGCRYTDVGSIFFGDGYVSWVDGIKIAHALHDLQSVVDISENQMKSYLTTLLSIKDAYNSRNTMRPQDQYRFIVGFDQGSNNCMLTCKRLTDMAVNNTTEIDLQTGIGVLPRTLVIDAKSKDYPGFVSFMPDAYGRMSIPEKMGARFFVFLQGNAWLHPQQNDIKNTFFDIATDSAVSVVVNESPEQLKIVQSFEIQCKNKWFLKKIVSSEGHISETPVSNCVLRSGRGNVPVFGNINSRGGIWGIEKPFGRYLIATFVSDNTDNEKYGTISTSARQKDDELSLISAVITMLPSTLKNK